MPVLQNALPSWYSNDMVVAEKLNDFAYPRILQLLAYGFYSGDGRSAGWKLPLFLLALFVKEQYPKGSMRRVIAFIQRLVAERFNGRVTLHIENGRIRHIKMEQVFQTRDFS